MATESFYGGKPYIFESNYRSISPGNIYGNFTGYNSDFSSLSQATDPRTANQIKEVSENLNTGIKNLEVGNVQPNVFEAIPTEHFKEINRLAQLTGAEITLHAPMVDPTGITDRGWDEMAQKGAEEQLWDAMKKGQVLNDKGTVVTFHASSVGLPSAEFKTKLDGKNEKTEFVLYVDSNGRIGQAKNEKTSFPSDTGEMKQDFNANELIKNKNKEDWDKVLGQMVYYASQGSRIAQHIEQENKVLSKTPEDQPLFDKFKEEKMKEMNKEIPSAELYLRDAYRQLKDNFDLIYKHSKGEDKKTLEAYKEETIKTLKEKPLQHGIKDPEELVRFAKLIDDGVETLRNIKEPEIYTPLKDFAIEKSAETTANLAWRSYNEFKDKKGAPPIIALENHPANQSLITTGEDLRDVIKKSHELFVKKAKAGGMSESEAKQQAEKLIGATWDVGHINMLRKYGYDKADILKQTKAVAPFIKKIHLSDNFGMEHTELPMGMGNVPFKEIMEKIKDGAEGYQDIKKIIEAGDWWQHFSPGGKSNHPLVPTMQGMGTPLTQGGYGWNQIYGVPGGYFGGYGTMLPDQNFQMYGAGFSSLPMELGGQIANKDSRLSGTPNA